MRILGLGLATSIPKLNEQKAIETGAQLLSEVIILSIASSILFYEYKRQMEKEDMKQSALDKEKSDIKEKIANLEMQVKTQSSSINELERLLCHLKEELEKAKETATASSSQWRHVMISAMRYRSYILIDLCWGEFHSLPMK